MVCPDYSIHCRTETLIVECVDARPDFAQWSTDPRMEEAAGIALGYLQFYLRPQVMITQGVMLEDSFFSNAVGLAAQRHDIPQITLPGNARDLMWMSLLDSSALRGNDSTYGLPSRLCAYNSLYRLEQTKG